jgi:hypothetical protein
VGWITGIKFLAWWGSFLFATRSILVLGSPRLPSSGYRGIFPGAWIRPVICIWCRNVLWVPRGLSRRGPVLDDSDGHVGERMLPTGQRGGEPKNNPQRADETRKSRKISHLREDNSEMKPGPLGWGFSIWLVTQSCKKVTLRILGIRHWKDRYTLQENGTSQVWPNPWRRRWWCFMS